MIPLKPILQTLIAIYDWINISVMSGKLVFLTTH